ncbi:hypothetical protein J5N97_008834 [Dioscorea zingiberensis]|uniref:Uncharacterized protein n=1 Tax=Dioscorea zingiberensis TaxID=325984 RepID=A0A9D5CX68_9LILI|nr:hypothetical protein J5N97_008834 [Dioscorea zingiberensis]
MVNLWMEVEAQQYKLAISALVNHIIKVAYFGGVPDDEVMAKKVSVAVVVLEEVSVVVPVEESVPVSVAVPEVELVVAPVVEVDLAAALAAAAFDQHRLLLKT